MPVLLLERLPLPSLEAYALVSVFLLFWSFHYAAEKTHDPEWRMQFVDIKNTSHEIPGTLQTILSRYWLSSRAQDIISFSIQDSLCIWVSVFHNFLFLFHRFQYSSYFYHYLFHYFLTDSSKYGLLLPCTIWKLAPEASFWRAESFRASAHQGQVLELCILQIYLHIWNH